MTILKMIKILENNATKLWQKARIELRQNARNVMTKWQKIGTKFTFMRVPEWKINVKLRLHPREKADALQRESEPKHAKTHARKKWVKWACNEVCESVRKNPRKRWIVQEFRSFGAEPCLLGRNPLTSFVGKIAEKKQKSRRRRDFRENRGPGECEIETGLRNLSGFLRIPGPVGEFLMVCMNSESFLKKKFNHGRVMRKTPVLR